MIGFDEIYDTTFEQILPVMEESKELVERLQPGRIFRCLLPALSGMGKIL